MLDFEEKVGCATAIFVLLFCIALPFIEAGILLWFAGFLATLIPSIAVIGTVTYWQWFGVLFALNIIGRLLFKRGGGSKS